MRISDLLLGSVARFPEKTAIQYLNQSITYQELYETQFKIETKAE